MANRTFPNDGYRQNPGLSTLFLSGLPSEWPLGDNPIFKTTIDFKELSQLQPLTRINQLKEPAAQIGAITATHKSDGASVRQMSILCSTASGEIWGVELLAPVQFEVFINSSPDRLEQFLLATDKSRSHSTTAQDYVALRTRLFELEPSLATRNPRLSLWTEFIESSDAHFKL